jgi:ribosomal protein S19E (S16A)
MSKQYYDVEVFWKKSYFVRVYAGNKKEAKEKAKELSPEKNPIKKYFDVLGEEGYVEGSWQAGNDITARGQDRDDWDTYDSIIQTVDSKIIHCQKHSNKGK